jgi:transcriptional regulator GlxA family with amidase domain
VKSNKVDVRVQAAVFQIQERYSTTFSVNELARSLNLSASRLRHLIKAEMGVPPTRFIKRLRMLRAQELLGASFLSVKQVGVRVGYNDPSHFVRDFKATHGVSPSQYRDTLLRQNQGEPLGH